VIEKVIQSRSSFCLELSAKEIEGIQSGVATLRIIRASAYEDINQIQHECLVLRALRWIVDNGSPSDILWEWNPRQTGTANEPDLRGSRNGTVLISAEASASERPIGLVDSRMRKTLEKLSRMEGQKYYFVCSEEMACRANTKIVKNKWSIKVILL
jgi:hypothetical protein